MFNVIQILDVAHILKFINKYPVSVHEVPGDTKLDILLSTERFILATVIAYITVTNNRSLCNSSSQRVQVPEWLSMWMTGLLVETLNNTHGNAITYVRAFIINHSVHIILTVDTDDYKGIINV